MGLQILISNEQNILPISEEVSSALGRTAKVVLIKEGLTEGELSLALVDDKYMQSLNARYRGEDKSTDVLAFPQDEAGLLGDVVISIPRAIGQAEEYGHSIQREVTYLLVHGILHLLGYDHMEEKERRTMRLREEKLIGTIAQGWEI